MLQHIYGVPTFGLFVAFGTFLTYLIAQRMARREGLDSEVVVDATLIIIIGGVVGCRALHVVQHWPDFAGKPWYEVLRLDRGGLSWYGCFFTILPAALIYFRWKRLDTLAMVDLFTVFVTMAQFLGRLGCFCNGCCWGMRVHSGHLLRDMGVCFPIGTQPWVAHVKEHLNVDSLSAEQLGAAFGQLPEALQSGSYPVLPVQLFMSAAGLVATLLWLWIITRPHRRGEAFLWTFLFLALTRFGFEALRADEPLIDGLTLAQWFSAGFTALALVALAALRRWGTPVSGAPVAERDAAGTPGGTPGP